MREPEKESLSNQKGRIKTHFLFLVPMQKDVIDSFLTSIGRENKEIVFTERRNQAIERDHAIDY